MNTRSIRFIAAWEIVGGIFGLGVIIIKLLSSSQSVPMIVVLFYITFVALFIVSVIAGVMLWKKSAMGFYLSSIIQLLQIPYFSISGLGYQFFTSAYFFLGIQFANSKVEPTYEIGLGSGFGFSIHPQHAEIYLILNIFALVILIYLLRNRVKILTTTPTTLEERPVDLEKQTISQIWPGEE